MGIQFYCIHKGWNRMFHFIFGLHIRRERMHFYSNMKLKKDWEGDISKVSWAPDKDDLVTIQALVLEARVQILKQIIPVLRAKEDTICCSWDSWDNMSKERPLLLPPLKWYTRGPILRRKLLRPTGLSFHKKAIAYRHVDALWEGRGVKFRSYLVFQVWYVTTNEYFEAGGYRSNSKKSRGRECQKIVNTR